MGHICRNLKELRRRIIEAKKEAEEKKDGIGRLIELFKQK